MAESEDRKVFKEGFATLTAQLKQNRADERQAEIDKAIQDRKDAQDAIDKAKELQKTQEENKNSIVKLQLQTTIKWFVKFH